MLVEEEPVLLGVAISTSLSSVEVTLIADFSFRLDVVFLLSLLFVPSLLCPLVVTLDSVVYSDFKGFSNFKNKRKAIRK